MNAGPTLGASGATRALPTGTVAFLFSDIEGSTARWERDPEAMTLALRRHDAVVRAAIEDNGGAVFKTLGDAFCAAFATVRDALVAAAAAQASLGAADFAAVDGLPVRVAIHAGTADERDGDYFGPVLNRVARLLAIAHGGQIVVSGTAYGLVAHDVPPPLGLLDCGTHRLKDLARPERVYQLVAPQLRERFPPLRSLDALPNNLPQALDAFVGREREIAEIGAALDDARLVTLLGAGGIGKTRVALQVAADVTARFPDGVWFVELAPLGAPQTIAPALASLFSVVEVPPLGLLESVVRALRSRTALLVFDNCEHLVREASATIETILRGTANVRVLATSREPLGIAGERAYRLPSLGLVPVGRTPPTAETAARSAAVGLFVARAREAVPSFELTDRNAPVVAGICRRLDGIAFALELAAARLRMLSIEQLADRLNERFRLLTGGARTALPRQQTMRATIDWSYELLDGRERIVFARLAIFNGGWTIDAAAEVCADEAIEGWDVLDTLGALVDKSLVASDGEDEARRFRLLESTRDYALEKLRASGECPRVARAHAAYFAAFGRRLAAIRPATDDLAWLALARAELENVRAVLEWAIDDGEDVALGAELVWAYLQFWTLSLRGEGLRWTQTARDRLDATAHPAIAARLDAALARYETIGAERRERSLAALASARRLGDPALIAFVAVAYARDLADVEAYDEAGALLDDALAYLRTTDDARARSIGSTYRADVARYTGDAGRARALFAEAIAGAKRAGATRALAVALGSSAELASDAERFDEAASLASESLELFVALRDSRNVVTAHANLCAYALARDRTADARTHARAALAILRDQPEPFLTALVVENMATVDALEGRLERAARLAGFAEAAHRARGLSRERTEARGYDRLVACLRALPPDERAALEAAGAALGEDEVMAEAAT